MSTKSIQVITNGMKTFVATYIQINMIHNVDHGATSLAWSNQITTREHLSSDKIWSSRPRWTACGLSQ
jgi:hypothetical protein